MPPRNARELRNQRYYDWRGERFWSVTTIIQGGVPKGYGFEKWLTGTIAAGAVEAHRRGILGPMIEQNAQAAEKYLVELPYAKRNRAAEIGTAVHERIEALTLERPRPPITDPEIATFVASFELFVEDFHPTWLASEFSVYNRSRSYAGTADAVVVLDPAGMSLEVAAAVAALEITGPQILDVKTGTGVYGEVALQLSAYRHAEFVGAPDGSEQPVPETTGGLVLHLRPEGYRLVQVRCDEDIFRAFLYVRETFRWADQTSKTVIGQTVAGREKDEEVTA